MMLTDLQKRWLLFLGGCMVARSLIAYMAYTVDIKWLPIMGVLALLPVLGWLYIYFISPRDTGPEVFGGKIWWNSLRPIHATLWFCFAVAAFKQSSKAYLFLVADVLLGLSAFLAHHLL